MANYFENLKNLIVEKLSADAKKGNMYKMDRDDMKFKTNTERRNTDQEETISLMDDTVKYRMPKLQQSDKSYCAYIIFSTKMLPFIYGFFGIFTVAFMITCAYINKMPDNLYTQVGPHKTKFLSFFDLPKINYFVYHLLNSTTGLLGLALVISVFMSIHMKFSMNKLDKFQIAKLYHSVAYGLLSNIFHIIYGAAYLTIGVEKINEIFISEIHINFSQFLFLLEIFFSILFGIFTSLLINNLKSKPSYALANENQAETERDYKWMNYKILSIIYLTFFTISYILIFLHSNHAILPHLNNPILKSNYSYLLPFLPYLIYSLNIILYCTFYDELRDANVTLVEPSDKMIYEYNQRNIL